VAPSLVFAVLIIHKIKSNTKNLKKINSIISKKIILFLVIYIIILTFFIKLIEFGDTSWDGLTYHLPIELMIRDSKSLWNWPDLVYAQWGLIGADVTNLIYHITFDNKNFGITPSIVAGVVSISIFLNIKIKSYRFIGIIVLFGIPSFLHQIGTRYVDMILATTLLIYSVYLLNVENHLPLRYKKYFTFILIGYIVSIKLTAIIPIFIIQLIVFLKRKQSLKNLKSLWNRELRSTSIGFFIGLFPTFFRNYVEKDDLFYPLGYESLLRISNFFTLSYKDQIGIREFSNYQVFNYQYLESPVFNFYSFIKQIFTTSRNFSSIFGDKNFYMSFVYDNRVSGIGLGIFLIGLVYIKSITIQKVIFLLLGYFIIINLPVIVHPRYNLGIILVLIFIVLSTEKARIKSQILNIFSFILITFTIAWSSLNIISKYNLLFPEVFNTLDLKEQHNIKSETFNPNCDDIVHVGSGIWDKAALWGPEGCGNLVLGIPIGVSTFGINYGDGRFSLVHVQQIEQKLLNKSSSKSIMICSYKDLPSSASEDYCDFVKNNIDEGRFEVLAKSEFMQEETSSPYYRKILLEKKN
jgi:hypothetical protein